MPPHDADGRFAPSPSGPLHLGNLRTALLAWCFARSQNARFLLRIEDLDPGRSRPEHESAMIADLTRLGLDWDGVPSRQSEWIDRHRVAFEQLRGEGRLYRCWCTRAEIRQALEAPHPPLRGAGTPAGGVIAGAPVSEDAYPGTCRNLGADDVAARVQSGAPAAWRLRAEAQRVGFVDELAGSQSAVVDDFVVWREGPPAATAAGLPAYNLAVVVDDAADGVGEVVRGDDLLETTPRQILLARLLGLAVPRYAHVPLVLGPEGRRLAKRDGAVRLEERLALGESVETVVGWLAASAGLAPAGAQLRAVEVLAEFDPARIARQPAVFDPGR